MEETNVFQTLSSVDITSKVKEKNKIKYLPWSSAWSYIKKYYPKASYEVLYDERTGNNYFTDGHTCWVEVELTIEGETQKESLAVMDFKNQSILAEKVTSADVNKSQKRCLTKCAALFGLGLNLWYGEELSDEAKTRKTKEETEQKKTAAALKIAKEKVLTEFKAAIEKGVNKEEIYDLVESITGHKNPNMVETVDDCEGICEGIKKMEAKKKK